MDKWTKRGLETTISEVFQRNIGVESLDEVNEWFQKSYDDDYGVNRMMEAVELALSFKKRPVHIVGDYDADGITSTSILYLALTWSGFSDVSYRIPKRFSEGFGISKTIINEIDDGLVITCDNGMAQVDAINYAKEKGLTVIILDHHEAAIDDDGNIVIPSADVIIDPEALEGSADFSGYCGAGLSYKFSRMLLGKRAMPLLALAAIGTVADFVPLREENYVIVRDGLKALRDSRFCTSGMYALVSAFDLSKHLTSHDIGFKIGPVINAASRMKDDGAKDVVQLLTFQGPYAYAVESAEKFVRINNDRKLIQAEGIQKAEGVIANDCAYGDLPMVLYIPGIQEGIIGIIAGNLKEIYHVPVIVFSDSTETGILKGSGRSIDGFNLKEALDNAKDLLYKYGGHPRACGCSIETDKLAEFRALLQRNAEGFIPPTQMVTYDLEISANQIPETIAELERYEPFGEENPEIIFKVNGFSVVPRYGQYKKLQGADLSTVKLFSNNATAVGFKMASRMSEFEEPKNLNFIGKLSDNYFNGELSHQVEFSDFTINEITQHVTPLAEKLRAMAMSK